MNLAYQSVVEHMDSKNYHYQAEPEQGLLRVHFSGKDVMYRCLLKVDEQLLQLFVSVGILVPEGARAQVAEALCRANFGLKVGRLELDSSNWNLGFHASSFLNSEELAGDLVARILSAAFWSLDTYVAALLSIIYGNEPPVEAIQRAERG